MIQFIRKLWRDFTGRKASPPYTYLWLGRWRWWHVFTKRRRWDLIKSFWIGKEWWRIVRYLATGYLATGYQTLFDLCLLPILTPDFRPIGGVVGGDMEEIQQQAVRALGIPPTHLTPPPPAPPRSFLMEAAIRDAGEVEGRDLIRIVNDPVLPPEHLPEPEDPPLNPPPRLPPGPLLINDVPVRQYDYDIRRIFLENSIRDIVDSERIRQRLEKILSGAIAEPVPPDLTIPERSIDTESVAVSIEIEPSERFDT